MGINRAARRAAKRNKEKVIYRTPGQELEMNGQAFRSGGIVNGLEMLTRDWNRPEETNPEDHSNANLDPSIVEAGIKSLISNAEAIRYGKTLRDISLDKKEVFFLVGAGGSLSDINKNLLDKCHEAGTTITTNRGLKWFDGFQDCLDFAFFVDSKLNIIAEQDWFKRYKNTGLKAIASLNCHPSILKGFQEVFWFGYSFGQVREWELEISRLGIDRSKVDTLDSGLCSLSTQLHFVYKQNPKAKIVLLGHDFSYHKGLKYFDLPFKATQLEQERIVQHPDFSFDVMLDKNGCFTLTQEYLKRQAQIISAQIDILTEAGAEVYNCSPGGMLYTPNIIQADLWEFLNEL